MNTIVTVNNARVASHMGDNGAFTIEDQYPVVRDGQQEMWKRYWKVWNKDITTRPEVDTFVSVSGIYGSRMEKKDLPNGDVERKHVLSINDPVISTDNDALIAGLVEVADADAPF